MASTLFLLMAEHGAADVPLETIARQYFGMTTRRAINERAARQGFPFPVRQAGGQRSPWLVSLADLAEWIDADRERARQDHERMHGRAS